MIAKGYCIPLLQASKCNSNSLFASVSYLKEVFNIAIISYCYWIDSLSLAYIISIFDVLGFIWRRKWIKLSHISNCKYEELNFVKSVHMIIWMLTKSNHRSSLSETTGKITSYLQSIMNDTATVRTYITVLTISQSDLRINDKKNNIEFDCRFIQKFSTFRIQKYTL